MQKTTAFLLMLLIAHGSWAQKHPLAKEIFKLINEARVDPQAFLKNHGSEIKRLNSRYADYLQQATPLPKAQWDNGLEKMTYSTVEEGNLNPQYAGENKTKICGYPQGSMRGNLSSQAITYMISFYTNTHNPDCQYFACYFNKSTSSYSFAWGESCQREKMTFKAPSPVDETKVDFTKLNTAARADYMSAAEQLMMLELNYVRAYPKVYALVVANHLEQEANSMFGLDFDEKLAGEELINELNEMTPLPVLKPSKCIFDAARAHGLDCQKRGYFAHTGSDGSHPWNRIGKYCPDIKTGNENGAGNTDASPRTAVISLLLDAGITSRGHRKNILDPDWTHAACYHYADPRYKNQWVQNFGHY